MNFLMKKLSTLLALSFLLMSLLSAQNTGRLSGNLETNGNFFIRDSVIGAANTPQFDRQLYGAEGWLNLNYNNWGFDVGLRFDFFNNSNRFNPQRSYSDQGIGRWYIRKKIDNLDITGGYIYDQIGSGVIFRAYEERALLIDNALLGGRLIYDLTPNWKVKVFTGKQKQQFDQYAQIVKGGSIEGYFALGDSLNPVTFSPGFGIVNRTIDDATMDQLVAEVGTYIPSERIKLRYNAYAYTLNNTLTYGPFNLYLEGAYKTREAMFDDFEPRTIVTPDSSYAVLGKFISKTGSLLYGSVGYSGDGFGITVEAKRTENFRFRSSPFLRLEKLNDGLIAFLPPMTRINTYRLTGRYNAATQELGEFAYQIDARYALNKQWSFYANFSNINFLDDANTQLYQEIFTEIQYKPNRKWQLLAGLQRQQYNQEIYESKPKAPLVETITPYADVLYKITSKKAIRFELQYMSTEQDYGSWAFGLAEFSIAPHWTFTVSDMYNIDPGKNSPVDENGEKIKAHYPRFDVFYTHKANRFSLSYIKQVEGVVCSGGICRLEPAFNGVRLTVNSTF